MAQQKFKYDDFKYDDFSYNNYQESDAVKQAKTSLDTQLSQKPGAYQSQWQTQLNDTMNKILNRDKFSYDLNGDALYQQYKASESRTIGHVPSRPAASSARAFSQFL